MDFFVVLLIVGGMIGLCVYFVKKKNREEAREDAARDFSRAVVDCARYVGVSYCALKNCSYADRMTRKQRLFGAVFLGLHSDILNGLLDSEIVDVIVSSSHLDVIYLGSGFSYPHYDKTIDVTEKECELVNAAMQVTAVAVWMTVGSPSDKTALYGIAKSISDNKRKIVSVLREVSKKETLNVREQNTYNAVMKEIEDPSFRKAVRNYK